MEPSKRLMPAGPRATQSDSDSDSGSSNGGGDVDPNQLCNVELCIENEGLKTICIDEINDCIATGNVGHGRVHRLGYRDLHYLTPLRASLDPTQKGR